MNTLRLPYPLATDAVFAPPSAEASQDHARTTLGADEARMLQELSLRAAAAVSTAVALTIIW